MPRHLSKTMKAMTLLRTSTRQNMLPSASSRRLNGLGAPGGELEARKQQPLLVPSVTEDDDDDDDGFDEGEQYGVRHDGVGRDPHVTLVNQVRSGHNREAMAYLLRYETMVRQQEAEDMATLAHIRPCIERVMVLADMGPFGTDVDNSYILTQEVSFSSLKSACDALQRTKEPSSEHMLTDRQLMMVLKLLTQSASVADDVDDTIGRITWAEFVQAYKVCIVGMMTLQHLPQASESRLRTRDRTLAMLSLFAPNSTKLLDDPWSNPQNLRDGSRKQVSSASGVLDRPRLILLVVLPVVLLLRLATHPTGHLVLWMPGNIPNIGFSASQSHEIPSHNVTITSTELSSQTAIEEIGSPLVVHPIPSPVTPNWSPKAALTTAVGTKATISRSGSRPASNDAAIGSYQLDNTLLENGRRHVDNGQGVHVAIAAAVGLLASSLVVASIGGTGAGTLPFVGALTGALSKGFRGASIISLTVKGLMALLRKIIGMAS